MLADGLMICWNIWSNRNGKWNGSPSKSPDETARGAAEILQRLRTANTAPKMALGSKKNGVLQYRAFLSSILMGQSSYIEIGSFWVWSSGARQGMTFHCCSTQEARSKWVSSICASLSGWEAIRFSTSIGLNKIVLEGDSVEIIGVITKPVNALAPWEVILQDIMIMIEASSFIRAEFILVRRMNYSVAHHLAKMPGIFFILSYGRMWHQVL